MNRRGSKLSLRFKLILITVLAVWGGATLNSLYISYREYNRAQHTIVQQAESVGNYIAFHNSTALVFLDTAALTDSLVTLRKDQELAYAVFTDLEGSPVASIGDLEDWFKITGPLEKNTVTFEKQLVHVAIPMRDQDENIGMFFLALNMLRLDQQIQEDTLRALGFNALLAAFLTLFMMIFLRRVIFKPMSFLSEGTRLISQGKFDISSSTGQITSKDEFGLLATSFENMAQTLGEKNHEIVEQNEVLKEREQSLQKINHYLSAYLPKQFVETVWNSDIKDVFEVPRRERLTVFFSDLKGFTSLTDQLDPETLFTMLNGYQNAMNEIVLKYDGTLDKYMGDGLMVFFGAPQSRGEQEDALRCCLMAIEMQNAMAELQKGWFLNGIEASLELRVGVHTGFGTVGSFGTESRLDYTAIGPVVNIASRLESACPPKFVKISHQTWANIQPFLETEEVDPIVPKGISRSMKTYVLKGIRPNLLPLLQEYGISSDPCFSPLETTA